MQLLTLFLLLGLCCQALGQVVGGAVYKLGNSGDHRAQFRVRPGELLLLNFSVPRSVFPDPAEVDHLRWTNRGVVVPGEDDRMGLPPLVIISGPADSLTFYGAWVAPSRTAFQILEWTAIDSDGDVIEKNNKPLTISRRVEVTCSNGIYCDGQERWNGVECIAGNPDPCDDDEPCTEDACTEQFGGHCVYTLLCPDKPCGPACTPVCTNETGAVFECGDDSCGSTCGTCDEGTEQCVSNFCVPVGGGAGTCTSPLPITVILDELQVYEGDSTNGANAIAPSCNVLSDAKEVVYSFTTPTSASCGGCTSFGGLFAVAGGIVPSGSSAGETIDTVLQLNKGDCTGTSTPIRQDPASVACADDSTPPGDLGSRLEVQLDPDTTYYLIIDGYSNAYFGPFELTVSFYADCLPNCDGNFCGNHTCAQVCGNCPNGQKCADDLKCYPDPCEPNCVMEDGSNATCGFDGCGGSCGSCSGRSTCDYDPSQDIILGNCVVQEQYDCDAFNPVCSPKCRTTQFCGGDCQCHALDEEFPDLYVNIPEMYSENKNFPNSSCAVFESCATTATERILRVAVRSINLGRKAISFPNNPKGYGRNFVFSTCHNHWHRAGYASYVLFDAGGNVLVAGGKQSYCLEDSGPVYKAPWIPCNAAYDCGNQGIQRGWTDEYGASLDCQWLDITGVPPGEYRLEVHINFARNIIEDSVDNNYAAANIVLDADGLVSWAHADDDILGFSSAVMFFPSLIVSLFILFLSF